MTENTIDFQTLFEALPGNCLIVQPNVPQYTIVAANDQFLHTAAMQREHIVGKNFFDVFPENPEAITATGPSSLRISLQNAICYKKPDQMPVVRYDVPTRDGIFEERYWTAINKPALNASGEVAYIIHFPVEVTSQVKADKQESAMRQIEKTYNLFMQAPVAVCIVSGPENIVELANEEMCQLLGRVADIVGKPLFASLPEAKAQGFPHLLDQVRKTGETIYTTEHPTTLLINGKAEKRYYNFVYQPYYQNTGDQTAAGVFMIAHEVTQQVTFQKQLAHQKSYLENAIDIADLGTFYVDVATHTGSYSEKVRDWFGLEGLQQPMEIIYSKVHPEDTGMVIQVISNSLESIEKSRHDLTYRILPAGSHTQSRYLRSIGKTIFEEGKAQSIMGIIQDVTPQIVSQLTLKESESRFRSLIEESPVATCLFTGRDLVIDVANEAMIELWGKGDSVLGKPLHQALPELERQPFFQILDEVYTSGKAYEANNAEVMRVVNGVPGLYYFNFTYKPLFNAAGQVYGILDVAIDVTEQVLSRKKVEESAAKYQGLFNSIDQGFCLIEMLFDENNKPIDYRFLEVNPTFSQQTGLKEAEGKTAREMVPDLEIHWFEIYGKVALTGEPIRFVEFSQAMSRWFDVYAFRIGGAENGKVALLFTNISQRKKAEEALKESENQLKFAIEATELATWDYNPFTNRLRGNSRLKEWFDLSAEEEVELSIAIEVIAEQDRERVSRAIEQSLQYASGGLYDVEYTIVHPATQTPRIVRAKGRAWFGEDRIAYRFNGTLQDVTREALAKQTLQASEQKAQLLAQELAAANEELLAANEKIQSTNEELGVTNAYLTRTNVDLDNFIYTASHDLKAPISNIESLLQALLRTLPPGTLSSGRAERITSLMQESVERFKKTINNLTDVVKLQKENNGEAVMVDLPEVIREVSLDLEPLIKSSGAELTVDIEDCPAIHFPEKNVRSVIYNLLSNAIKYRAPERVPQVLIHCELTSGYHQLTVKDNGLGMEPRRLDQLFTMFKRFHDHVEGSGIGLYMVKKIVENAGGRIEVESQVGVGSTFRVYFRR